MDENNNHVPLDEEPAPKKRRKKPVALTAVDVTGDVASSAVSSVFKVIGTVLLILLISVLPLL